MEKITKYSFVLIIITAIFVFLPKNSFASDLGFSPISGVFTQNSSFSVDIVLLNNDVAINAVSGTVSFPTDLLSVKSISKDGSIIKLWSIDPTYSNSEGTINFEGVIFNPGFDGNRGKVLTVTFNPKKTGKADLFYKSGSVLANDGKATNVLRQLGTASFVNQKSLEVSNGNTSSPVENPLVPLAPKITSTTNPDPNKWYQNTKPSFSWTLPGDTVAVRTLYDKNPSSIPTKVYQPPISSRTLEEVTDGVYYFHVQLKNDYGWGGVAHFRFQIDTDPPNPFSIAFPNGATGDNPQPVVLFNTTDGLSGIDRYEIKVDQGDLLNYTPEVVSNSYTLPIQQPGKHTVVVRAIDKAGNSTLQSADFTTSPIQAPNLINYPIEIEESDIINITGTTYSGATITLFIKNKEGQTVSESAKSNALGEFSFSWSKKLNPGIYEITAITTDNRGAKSGPTLPINLNVKQKALWRIGSTVVTYLSLSIMVIVALASLVAFAWYVVSQLRLLRRKLRKDINVAEIVLHKDFEIFREDFKSDIKLLEGAKLSRKLTKEELYILKNLIKRVDKIEEAMEQRFSKIKKDIG